MSKLKILLFIIFNSLALYYLFIPTPEILDLPNSLKSVEPGDTVQIPNVKAFYNDQERQQIIDFYVNTYQKKHPLSIKINHRPEKAKEIIKDTIQTYYLEEIIIPFKESLYINGFEWEKDVFTIPEKRAKNRLMVGKQEFKTKITLRHFPTNPINRLIVFLSLETFLFFAFHTYKSIFSKKQTPTSS
ncbi:hypothetical protein KKC08_02635 [Patescibacteria group bacterium]|nr:hypothetical protein [Patescibacteria group bacterium]MCG2702126.1 hypothetical protein [Candidatus Parcubacteria bacterium]MBU4265079.1 hypothetical protein [Patescibacteria group bacterium]MBU4389681.1 hypothetical protein [Patescibacteria group bacterium]MBU4397034.1 hypothetical protein [Patescibacteria group bacterium]